MEGVAHNVGPQRKRRRVEKACETCRRRKERCNGTQPKCSNCQVSGRKCEYLSETKKRGLPGGWLRALEKFWAIAIQRAPGLEDDVISVVTTSLSEPQNGHLAALWTDEADDRGLLKSWRASRLAAELEGLLPSLERLPQRRMDDPSLESAFYHSQKRSIGPAFYPAPAPDIEPEASGSLEDAASTNLAASVSNPVLGQTHSPPSHGAGLLPKDTLDMIDSYFSWTHVWFPVLERHKVYETYHQWVAEQSRSLSGDQACLLAIIVHQKVQREVPGKGGAVCTTSIPDIDVGYTLQRVRDLIPTEHRLCQLSHMQALLILSLAYLGARLADDAWLLVGQTTRLALLERTIQVPNSATANNTAGPERNRLSHVVNGCFILDTLISTVAGLPSHLRDRDLTGLSQLDEDGIDEWTSLAQPDNSQPPSSGPAFAISTFNQLLQLTRLLSGVSPKAWSSVPQLDHLQAVLAELQSWNDQRPAQNRHKYALVSARRSVLPHQLTVHLLHICICLIVYIRLAVLQSDLTRLQDQIASQLENLDKLVREHALHLDTRAMPPTWELILSSILNEIDKAVQLCDIPILPTVIHTLEMLTASAKKRWPCFESLHGRTLSHQKRSGTLNVLSPGQVA